VRVERTFGWRPPAGGWRLAAGGLRLAACGWRLAARGSRPSAFGLRLAAGRLRLAAGGSRLTDSDCRSRLPSGDITSRLLTADCMATAASWVLHAERAFFPPSAISSRAPRLADVMKNARGGACKIHEAPRLPSSRSMPLRSPGLWLMPCSERIETSVRSCVAPSPAYRSTWLKASAPAAEIPVPGFTQPKVRCERPSRQSESQLPGATSRSHLPQRHSKPWIASAQGCLACYAHNLPDTNARQARADLHQVGSSRAARRCMNLSKARPGGPVAGAVGRGRAKILPTPSSRHCDNNTIAITAEGTHCARGRSARPDSTPEGPQCARGRSAAASRQPIPPAAGRSPKADPASRQQTAASRFREISRD